MTLASDVLGVRDVRAPVRDRNVRQTVGAQGLCGMCGHWPTWAGACVCGFWIDTASSMPRARKGARTSRTRRTGLLPQSIHEFRRPHSPPHVPHTLARAKFIASTVFKGNGVGGSND
ncbi:MAG TPA: hypothetical protein DIW85_11805 [Stenotrophomonas sp.]|nr:hypothetical protein [Stenotrophomonas sp.]